MSKYPWDGIGYEIISDKTSVEIWPPNFVLGRYRQVWVNARSSFCPLSHDEESIMGHCPNGSKSRHSELEIHGICLLCSDMVSFSRLVELVFRLGNDHPLKDQENGRLYAQATIQHLNIADPQIPCKAVFCQLG